MLRLAAIVSVLFLLGWVSYLQFELWDQRGINQHLRGLLRFHSDVAERNCTNRREYELTAQENGMVTGPGPNGWAGYRPAGDGVGNPNGGFTVLRIEIVPPPSVSKDRGTYFFFNAEGCPI